MNSNINATKANKTRLNARKGLGKHMAYELNKVNSEENYEKNAKKSNNNKSVTSFLNLIQSNDKILQHKKNDLDELKKKNKNLKQALKTVPTGSSNNNTISDFPETKVDTVYNNKFNSKKDKSLRKTVRSISKTTPADLIGRLQDQGDMFARKIEVEKRKIDDLQSKIDTLLAKSADQRKKMGGINAARENQMAVNKRLKVLENRLDQAMIKYNESLSKNKHLREEINESRRQRLVYDSVYKKLEDELATKKHRMAKIIAESNRAYEVRDKLLLQLNELKEKVDVEQSTFETEWAKLGNAISVETGGRDARKRELERRDAEEEQEKLRKKAVGEEQRLKSKVLSGAWKIAKEKAHLALSQERITAYEDAFAKILATTGISDINVLVDKFIAAEEKNFSMFNYVNHLNEEIEKLDIAIAEVKGEIDKYRGQDNESDNQRKKILRELEGRLARTENRVKDYDNRHRDAVEVLAEIKEEVLNVYEAIGCKSISNLAIINGPNGITDSNLMQYLGVIEQRTNEILQMYYATVQNQQGIINGGGSKDNIGGQKSTDLVGIHTRPGVSEVLPMGEGPTVPTGTVELKIEPPRFEDHGPLPDEQMDDERPLTRAELMKVAGKYAKKAQEKSAKLKGLELGLELFEN